ncbi:hypothetical protein PSHT_10733 [Puccinia striiformis]|uniref:SAP domain-containing protein n=3 Tax=Puccinia striiformis TaxID=27350 RepID=A0A0L0VD36_9BASI|nr:hypothetical protein H4Q26_014505 [Puccinia striiformis f. sp. tritici PST-130]KAI9629031.1 hypothetical protein H4Q26_018354 [Puccinia striiformis f. sp. tritici PST-130]KNE97203.1 hypothetical protein PSTG_09465 [Puccinia striiformis f. sp. tritici PST-78]POV98427.1 hypothetical protein PSTT_14443 [Puccinia striiformis]POW05585.1 hypothetical protein PSHT_10733 [Puccinia striiformis]
MATPNKAALSASKVTELKALCSQNSLPVSGNKGELINRLLAHFESVQASTPQATPSKDLITSNAPPPPTHSEPPSKPAAASTTISQAVEPTQTDAPSSNTQPATTDSTNAAEKTIDDELEKRKQRAQRFGLKEPANLATTDTSAPPDDLKKSIRAKRFGLATELTPALDQPLSDSKVPSQVVVKSSQDLEWEARKRKRAEKFGLVDNPTSEALNDNHLHRKNQKFNRNRY